MPSVDYDAVVVGSGPNGLAAATTLARAGCSVLVVEAVETIGGGLRSKPLTLPGFVHDVCAAIHPLAAASPFFRSLPLAEHGVTWVEPDAALAHPLADGQTLLLERSLEHTGAGLGTDGSAYVDLMAPLVQHWESLMDMLLGPLRLPRHPLLLARFGLSGLRSAQDLARGKYTGEEARALFAGLAAHAVLPLDKRPTAAFGLVLAILGHAVGWPLVCGGSQRLADAMASYLESLGGHIQVNAPVNCVDELPASRVVLLDVTPRHMLQLAGHRLPNSYRRQLARYRYGPGVFKMDWALDAPIPWRAEPCRRAATLHLGGTLDEIARTEHGAFHGQHSERTVRHSCAAKPVRRHPRPGWPPYRLGLLPRAARLDAGRVRTHRAPDRTLRARIPGPHSGPPRHGARGFGTLQCQLRGRRHQWRRAGLAPTLHPTHRAVDALRNAGQNLVHLFRLNAPRRRGARHERIFCCPGSPAAGAVGCSWLGRGREENCRDSAL